MISRLAISVAAGLIAVSGGAGANGEAFLSDEDAELIVADFIRAARTKRLQDHGDACLEEADPKVAKEVVKGPCCGLWIEEWSTKLCYRRYVARVAMERCNGRTDYILGVVVDASALEDDALELPPFTLKWTEREMHCVKSDENTGLATCPRLVLSGEVCQAEGV